MRGAAAVQHPALGGEEQAIDWLESKGVDTKLEVREWKRRNTGGFLIGQSLARAVSDAIGLPGSGADILRELGGERLFLDGLLSVWQPAAGATGDK